MHPSIKVHWSETAANDLHTVMSGRPNTNNFFKHSRDTSAIIEHKFSWLIYPAHRSLWALPHPPRPCGLLSVGLSDANSHNQRGGIASHGGGSVHQYFVT